MTMPALADRLIRHATGRGQEPRLILAPAAAAVLLLGAGDTQPALLEQLGSLEHPAAVLRDGSAPPR